MKFQPLHDRVVIRRLDADEKTAGGIIIPDTAQEKPMQGEVVAVGPDRDRRPPDHERIRHHGRHRGFQVGEKESCLIERA